VDLLSESNRLAADLAINLKKVLFEEAKVSDKNKIIVAYSGEFQPFHASHYEVYEKLVDKFGKDNVFIVTGESDDDEPDAPLNFVDKKQIVTELFDIAEDHVEQVDNPYIPKELLEKFNPSSTSFITVVDGDAARQLEKSEYFERYADDIKLKTYKQAGYFLEQTVLSTKIGNQSLSDPQLVQVLGSESTKEETKNKILNQIFPKQNTKIFDLLKNKTKKVASSLNSYDSKASGNVNGGSDFKKTDASGSDNKSPKVSGGKNKPVMQRTIRNPDSGKEIKIQSALKYPRWKPVYKMANQVLKAAGIDRKDRVKEPEVNTRYKARAKKTNEDLVQELTNQIISELIQNENGSSLKLHIDGYGNINFKLPVTLNEGGAAGHLAHPYDDGDLTFDDLNEMVRRGLSTGLDSEAPVTEKLDGQNIQFSYKNGKVVFARNTGHTKNSGATALDVDGIKDKFAGRGDLEAGFGNAADDLSAAVNALSLEQRASMFKDGSKWVNLEIINPKTQNVIPYDKNVLVFHNTVEYDKDGTVIDLGQAEGGELARSMQKVGAAKQKTYGIQGPQNIAFSDHLDDTYKSRQLKYIQELDEVRKASGLSGKSKLSDYFKKEWSDKIDIELKQLGVKLPPDVKSGLINRWAMYDKSFGAVRFKKEYPQLAKWFAGVDGSAGNINKDIRKPIEMTFLKVGADSLARMSNFMSANNPIIGDALKKEVLDVITRLKADPSKASELLNRELERLEKIGFDKITPTEGVVFIYNGKPYKFTGTFAPINQLMGVFKFDKGVNKEEKKDTVNTQNTKPIVVYPGRFQPFHVGHYSVYKNLVDKYGEDNVYIGTSDKTDDDKSPFGFNDKKSIIEKMFKIPADKIVNVKNPYAPAEILSKYPENTSFVTAVSSKDADRLNRGGKYFKPVSANQPITGNYKDVGYVETVPEFNLDVNGKNISGTTVRDTLGNPNTTDTVKKNLFVKMYGHFDPDVFKLITSKLSKLTSTAKPVKKSVKAIAKKAAPEQPVTGNKNSVLDKKIRNPETGNDILVRTALKYDKSHPARKAAMKLVTQSQR
jgi:nicotinamide mononucleotide adenylyltransferase